MLSPLCHPCPPPSPIFHHRITTKTRAGNRSWTCLCVLLFSVLLRNIKPHLTYHPCECLSLLYTFRFSGQVSKPLPRNVEERCRVALSHIVKVSLMLPSHCSSPHPCHFEKVFYQFLEKRCLKKSVSTREL